MLCVIPMLHKAGRSVCMRQSSVDCWQSLATSTVAKCCRQQTDDCRLFIARLTFHSVAKFTKSKIWDNVPKRSALIFEIPFFNAAHLSQKSATSAQPYRLVTDRQLALRAHKRKSYSLILMHCASKNETDVAHYNPNPHQLIWRYLVEMRFTNISALPGETWTTEIVFSVMLYAVSRKRRCFISSTNFDNFVQTISWNY